MLRLFAFGSRVQSLVGVFLRRTSDVRDVRDVRDKQEHDWLVDHGCLEA